MPDKCHDVGGIRLPRPFHVQRLGHVGLSQCDLDGSAAFWRDRLGFRETDVLAPPGAQRPLGFFNNCGTDHHSVVHIDARLEANDPNFAKGITVNQISFQVGTLQEVVDANAYFAAKGFGIWRHGRDSPGSNWATYTYDPDGFRVELYYGMEQVGWDRRSKPRELFTAPDYRPTLPEPAEFTEILLVEAKLGTIPPGFRPDEPMAYDHVVGGVRLQRPFAVNKVGPAYLFVEDVAKSRDFYERHVGLVLTEEVETGHGTAAFLRCGSDHHVLGLLPVALQGQLDVDQATRLFAVGVELGSYRQLRDAVAWLRAAGVAVTTDLPAGLHPGIDYAAFVIDPSGHGALLYSGMEQIGWDGRPRPAELRRVIAADWPDALDPLGDTNASLTRQGPMA